MYKILIVDDEMIIRDGLAELLTYYGYLTFRAADGIEGIKYLEKEKPDLVITDIIMPEQDGIGFLLEARKIYPSLKVIAISGGGKISADCHLSIAEGLGAEKILAKPFTSAALVKTVRELLEGF